MFGILQEIKQVVLRANDRYALVAQFIDKH